MKYVVDASVVAKWFNEEEYSDKAVKLKDLHAKGVIELIAPVHVIYEVGNSIWKNKQLSTEDAKEAIAALIQLDLTLISPTRESVKRAMEIARDKNMTFYDAVYIELAERYRVPLITADNTQAEKARDLVKIIHIRDLIL